MKNRVLSDIGVVRRSLQAGYRGDALSRVGHAAGEQCFGVSSVAIQFAKHTQLRFRLGVHFALYILSTGPAMRGGEVGVRFENTFQLCVGRVINRYKVAKHFAVTITDTTLSWTIRTTRVETKRRSTASI